MSDVLVGLLAVLVGGLFCFRGYLAMRAIIPVWGGFAGFLLGAGLMAQFTSEGVLGSVLAWAVAFGVAVVFAALAYLYYEVSVLLAMSAIGFALGTSLLVALGVTWSWLIILAGVSAGVLLAVLAIAANLPMVLLTLLTALAGASTVVTGIMLMVGTLSLGDFDSAATTQQLADEWWWYAIYVLLVLSGIAVQVLSRTRMRASLRESWAADGGRQWRSA